MQAAQLIPPVGDLVLMGVREAFTPEIASRFGQYEGFPEPLAEWAEKQGLSREWAERYWAAHWSLPSPQMGFEMLHRGVIGQEDLDLLLRALDIMPFWRDKLSAISYNPLTRVDVRRMHALGVLDRAGVKRAYLDVGYSDENAELLTVFTERLNAPPPADEGSDLATVSRASIVSFYNTGSIERDEALLLLTDLGYTVEAAEMYLDKVDLDTELSERKAITDLLSGLAVSGVITHQEVQNELSSNGFTEPEIKVVLADITSAERDRTRLPSKTDLNKMLAAEIIDEVVYLDSLGRLGYSPTWSARYLALLTKEDADAE